MTIDTQKPIVSRETQKLIDLCHAVAQGGRDRVPELQAYLQERHLGLAQAWENFAAMIEKESPEFVEPRKLIIEAVEAQYQAFAQALEKVSAFIASPSTALHDSAVAALQEASPMLRAALMTYEMSILTEGSSKFPAVNLFENLSKRLRLGELPEPNWKSACSGHGQFYGTAIEEIDKSKAPNAVGIPERRAALATLVDIFKKLEEMGPTSSEADFAKVMDSMSQTFLALEGAVNAYNYHTLCEAPTASAEANRIIHAFELVRDHGMPVEILRGSAALFQEQVKQSLEGMHTATRLPAETQTVAEELPHMLEAMEAMDDALESLKVASEPWSEVEPVIEALKAAVGRLSTATDTIKTQTEALGKVLCPHCQAPNVPSARTCEKCQRSLPQFTGSAAYDTESPQYQASESGPAGPRDMVITSAMRGLYDAVENYEKGKLDQEGFIAVLRANEERVRRAEETLARTKIPDLPETATDSDREKVREFLDLTNDMVGLLAQGVGSCTAGLMKLEKYAREDTILDMREGLKEFFEGCHKLQQIELVAKAMLDLLPPAPEGAGKGTKSSKPGAKVAAKPAEGPEGSEASEAEPPTERVKDGSSLSDEVI